jgi:DNA-binding transcriptional regulator of glucitol operon
MASTGDAPSETRLGADSRGDSGRRGVSGGSGPSGGAPRTGSVGSLDPVRRLLTPGWIAFHIMVIAVAAVMVWLGVWQWTGGFTSPNARHTGYALQWFVFAAFAVYFWMRLMRDAVRGRQLGAPSRAGTSRSAPAQKRARRGAAEADAPEVGARPAYREYRMPTAPVVADDSDLGRYNAYLASLTDAERAAASAPADPSERVGSPAEADTSLDAPARLTKETQ